MEILVVLAVMALLVTGALRAGLWLVERAKKPGRHRAPRWRSHDRQGPFWPASYASENPHLAGLLARIENDRRESRG